MEKILTIVIPVYNTEKYLKKCLDSITTDKVIGKVEILVIIDGSKDGSKNIALEYARQYPESIFVVDKENGGHGSTINSGLDIARGKYFKVLDSDDWFSTKDFVDLVEFLSGTDVDLIMTHVIKTYVYENRSVLDFNGEIALNKHYDLNELNLATLPFNFFAMARCAYRTQKLKENQLKLLEKVFFEDTYLHTFIVPFIHTFVYLDLHVYHYFLGRPGQSVSFENRIKHISDWILVIDQMMDYFNSHIDDLDNDRRQFMVRVKSFYINHLVSQILLLPLREARDILHKLDETVRKKKLENVLYSWKVKAVLKSPLIVVKYAYRLYEGSMKLLQ